MQAPLSPPARVPVAVPSEAVAARRPLRARTRRRAPRPPAQPRRLKPRTLFVSRTRYALPLDPAHAQKFAAIGRELDYRVLASAAAGARSHDAFRLVSPVRPRILDGPLFYALLPFRVARELRGSAPDAVVAQSPYEGAAVLLARRLAHVDAKLVVEVHGDWRTATRLYGRRRRRLLGPLADRVAAHALRRADAVRTVSAFTASLVRELGIEPAAVFHAFTDVRPFVERSPEPLPAEPRAVFVGVLERYKNIAVLAEAWRLAAPRLPGATLELVGRGPQARVVAELLSDLPSQTVWRERLEPQELAALLDRSTCLVLPSASEGLPRIVIEALARGRPIVGSRGGGIPETVADGVNALLVPVGDAEALATALVRILSDRALASRLAAGTAPALARLLVSPKEYARSMRGLVDAVAD